MKIFNKNNIILATALLGASVSSCSLDMLPLNDVVLENYWTDKNDVQSVVTSCYVGMASADYINDLIVWGEDRSDNVVPGPDVPDALRDLMKGSLKTTNSWCDWSAMYNVINRCNTVLYYAPLVAEEDPNYTQSDLRINIAECKALRAISYLNLIKTFRDVPFTLEPSIDDNVEYRLPQTKFEVILDKLIEDIESCKNDAPRKYSNERYNHGKITRAAMYSILAELYLWRASDKNLTAAEQNEYYRKCISSCDWVLNFKIQQYIDNNIESEDLTKCVDPEVWNKYGYPLLSEILRNNNSSNASLSLFGDGDSFESIFEISSHYGSTYTVNTAVGYHYGGEDTKTSNLVQYVAGNEDLMTDAPTGKKTYDNTDLFTVCSDMRTIQSFIYSDNGVFKIIKYACDMYMPSYRGQGNITYTTDGDLLKESTWQSYVLSSLESANWIVYRLSEIMLFRAEAEIEIAGNLSKEATSSSGSSDSASEATSGAKARKAGSVAIEGATLSTAEALYDDAFNLISAVYLRSNPAAKQTNSFMPQRSNFKSLAEFEALLMNERRREFLFEGKRYFDLVRQARREGNTNKFSSVLSKKYGDGGSAIGIKMKQMDFMYMPVLKTQVQVNPNLKQNSAYLDEETIVNN